MGWMDGWVGGWYTGDLGGIVVCKMSGDGDEDGMLGLEGRYGGILWW